MPGYSQFSFFFSYFILIIVSCTNTGTGILLTCSIHQYQVPTLLVSFTWVLLLLCP